MDLAQYIKACEKQNKRNELQYSFYSGKDKKGSDIIFEVKKTFYDADPKFNVVVFKLINNEKQVLGEMIFRLYSGTSLCWLYSIISKPEGIGKIASSMQKFMEKMCDENGITRITGFYCPSGVYAGRAKFFYAKNGYSINEGEIEKSAEGKFLNETPAESINFQKITSAAFQKDKPHVGNALLGKLKDCFQKIKIEINR